MTSAAPLKVLQLLESAGIAVWLDGGWGVDALLRTQTREHKDVDIIVPVADVPKLQEVLATAGFSGRGLIGGASVRCLSPSAQVLCHAYGDLPVEKDYRDMELLAKQFNIDLPPQLRRRPPEGSP